MRNTSVVNASARYRRRGVLPVVVIGCLVVLAWLFIKALHAIADPGNLPAATSAVSAHASTRAGDGWLKG